MHRGAPRLHRDRAQAGLYTLGSTDSVRPTKKKKKHVASTEMPPNPPPPSRSVVGSGGVIPMYTATYQHLLPCAAEDDVVSSSSYFGSLASSSFATQPTQFDGGSHAIAGRRRSHTPQPGGGDDVDASGNHLFNHHPSISTTQSARHQSSPSPSTGRLLQLPGSPATASPLAVPTLASPRHSLDLEQLLSVSAAMAARNHEPPGGGTKETALYDEAGGPEATEPFISLNVGGRSYILSSRLAYQRCPTGTLAELVRCDHPTRLTKVDAYFDSTAEYFYARSSQLFDSIYRFYCSGHLHRPLDVCLTEFKAELDFWNLDDTLYSSCCFPRKLMDEDEDESKEDEFTDVRYGEQRRRLWKFIEGSGTTASNIFSFLSILFVLLSVGGLVISSIPELQVPMQGELPQNRSNASVVTYHVSQMEPHPAFTYLESICIVWFTAEFLVRFLTTPAKWPFLKGALNIVDLLAIVPFYLELTLNLVGMDTNSLRNLKGALLVIRILRVLRVVRIFKLGRYSAGMRTFALTLKSSAKQLGMMAMVMTTGVIFFSTMVYFLEKDEPHTPFSSIPAAFWWCIVTMTTVGYGDVVPVTLAGKIVASGAIVSGVLVLALPITIIVDNFMKVSGNFDESDHLLRQEEPEVRPKRSSIARRGYFAANQRAQKARKSIIDLFAVH